MPYYPPGTPPAEHAPRLALQDPRLSCPMRSIGPAKRPQRNGDPVKRRLCFQVFSRATTSPATVSIYSTPAVSARPCSEHQFTLMSCSLQRTHGLSHTLPPGKTPSASRPHPIGCRRPAAWPDPAPAGNTVPQARFLTLLHCVDAAETEHVFMRTLRTLPPW